MFDRCLAPLFGLVAGALLCALFLVGAVHAFHQPSSGIGLSLVCVFALLMTACAGVLAAFSALCLAAEVSAAVRLRRRRALMDSYFAQRRAHGGVKD